MSSAPHQIYFVPIDIDCLVCTPPSLRTLLHTLQMTIAPLYSLHSSLSWFDPHYSYRIFRTLAVYAFARTDLGTLFPSVASTVYSLLDRNSHLHAQLLVRRPLIVAAADAADN